MVEAVFEGTVGQAFTDEFEQASYRVEDLLEIECDGIFATGSTSSMGRSQIFFIQENLYFFMVSRLQQ